LLFPSDPARAEKRYDRALALARASEVELLTLGGVEPDRVATWINAANAVIVPSEREGFGLAVLEALACEGPVLATPVGIHPGPPAGLGGTLCAPFELSSWRAALEPHLRAADPRVDGRASAERFSARGMAARVAGAWRASLGYGENGPAVEETSATTSVAAPPQKPDEKQPVEGGSHDGAPGFRAQGRARRRLRFLRKARELAYRDLGGLVFDLHRFGRRNDPLVLAKLGTLREIDTELRSLEVALDERQSLTILREAGVTACPRCAAIHSGEDNFCPNCGLPVTR